MEIKDLEIILKEHTEVIGDTRRFVNLLGDYFLEEQKKTTSEEGIIDRYFAAD